ncbi:MAG: PilZ domain-containing protein [Brevibacillus sp.]|nr:PilZ domain-containing protein [Brevibacillus sp.]
MTEKTAVNQRRYFRLDLDPPLQAQMSIVRIKDNQIESGEARVLVDNLSAGGLRFLSTLKLPVESQVVLQFQMRLLGRQVKPLGYIVRKSELSSGLYQYGVTFTVDEELKALLVRMVSELQIKFRRGTTITSCDFYDGDVLTFFQNKE